MVFNILLIVDPYYRTNTGRSIRDFLIGALLGVNLILLYEYLNGILFVEANDEDDSLYVLTLMLKLVGILAWSLFIYIIYRMTKRYLRVRG